MTELEQALEHYQRVVRTAAATGDWTLFAELFTDDADYFEPDPGDGSTHETSNLTILHYAGANRFSYEEDVYNPMNFAAMVGAWAAVADRHGTLGADGRAWLDRFAPSAGPA